MTLTHPAQVRVVPCPSSTHAGAECILPAGHSHGCLPAPANRVVRLVTR